MRRRHLLAVGVALLVVTGCGTTADDGAAVPDREPDVTGVVARPGGSTEPALAEASDAYYEGMSLVRGEPVIVRDGEPVRANELRPGTAVSVWTADACAESYPVQCEILAVRIDG